MNNLKNFSIIIPVYNEEGSIENLIKQILIYIDELKNTFEIIIVDDCSKDNTPYILGQLKDIYKLRVLNNDKNEGQSFSIYKGIINSSYDTIITLDGDGQNNPKDIIKLIKIYESNINIKLVSGIRANRKDSKIKIYSSYIANSFRSFILKDKCKDTGCSLKIFDKKIFLSFTYFSGIHRFIPALFNATKNKMIFIEVDHKARISGKSKYGTFDRLFKGIIDLIRVIIIINKIKSKNE